MIPNCARIQYYRNWIFKKSGGFTQIKRVEQQFLLNFSIEKCKIMHMGHKLAMSYSISRADGTVCRVAEEYEEEDLGVILTNDLKAGRQFWEAARKAMNILRTKRGISPDWTKQPS